jgi:hypothetical protein
MRALCLSCGLAAAVALALTGGVPPSADARPAAEQSLQMAAVEKEYLTLEPVLVTLRLTGGEGPGGSGLWDPSHTTEEVKFRFEAEPPVKARPKGKSLPAEKVGGKRVGVYDLLEWLQLPAEGTLTVRAVFEGRGVTLRSNPVTVVIRRPGKGDPEAGPVDRLHHIPWSNYVTDAFCGDTFDVVKRWPESRLAKYCHYWNGLHLQHKKEYDKAIASFRTVVTRYPNWVLADHANYGIVACLDAQGKADEAGRHLKAMRLNLKGTADEPSADERQVEVRALSRLP